MTPKQIKRDRRNELIVALCRGGLSEREIADRVGLAPSRVDQILEKLGIDPPPRAKTERRKNRQSLDPRRN